MRISYSALDRFKECPTKYYLAKKWQSVEKSSALFFGTVVEDGINELLSGETLERAFSVFEANWTEQPPTKFSPKPTPIYDNPNVVYYASDRDEKLLTKEDWDEIDSWEDLEEQQLDNRISWLCCLRRGFGMIQAFYDEVFPEIEEVVYLQKEISLKNADGDEATGYIDLIAKLKGKKKPLILDIKTAASPYGDHKIDTSDQLRLYSHAEKIDEVGYIVLVKKPIYTTKCDSCGHERKAGSSAKNCTECKKTLKGKYTIRIPKFYTQLIHKKTTKAERESLIDDAVDIVTAIKNEIKWKNPNSCENFNKKCEFYDSCWKNKKLEDLEHLESKGIKK